MIDCLKKAQADQLHKLETLSRMQLFNCDIFNMKLMVDNFATRMRGRIYKMPNDMREKALSGLRNSNKKLIPKEYHSEVIFMTEYNCYNRLKCPVEQAMLDNVISAIMKELLDEEGSC